MALHYYTLGKSEALREDLLSLIIDRALFADDAVPRKQAAYEALRLKAAPLLTATADTATTLAAEILAHYHALMLLLDPARKNSDISAMDVRDQLAALMPSDFLRITPWPRLLNLPRYLAGMRLRLQKLAAGGKETVDRDFNAMAAVSLWHNRYLERRQKNHSLNLRDPELELFRWMLEEFRISLFAQELGTEIQISDRRLERQWEKVRK
jgi:ATP-dependent helicase HrpA